MAIRLGMDCKLYYNKGGTWVAPVWSVINNAKDVTLNLETGEADVTTRGNGGWRATLATLKEESIEFELVWETTDLAFKAIQQAYFSNGSIEMAAMDGDITTAGDYKGDATLRGRSNRTDLNVTLKFYSFGNKFFLQETSEWHKTQ